MSPQWNLTAPEGRGWPKVDGAPDGENFVDMRPSPEAGDMEAAAMLEVVGMHLSRPNAPWVSWIVDRDSV